MKIVSDTSTLFSIEEGAEHGLEILPLTVSIDGQNWLEYEEMSSEEFLKRVKTGQVPSSSSPPPAMILDAYDTDEELIHITIADGLSGAYEVANGLLPQARHPEKVHILNSRTLCVPHRILALHAVQLAKQGFDSLQVITKLQEMMKSVHSYLIPADFDFLRRGGRLTPLAAKIVTILKAVPVMEQTEDGKRLERFTVTRLFNKAIDAIAHDLQKKNVDENFYIGVSHAGNFKQASIALEKLREYFPRCKNGLFDLSPAFITQGGPGCVAIQIIDIGSSPNLEGV